MASYLNFERLAFWCPFALVPAWAPPNLVPRGPISEDAMGGGKRGRKTSRRTPLPKSEACTPLRRLVRFPTPLKCRCSVFLVQKSKPQHTRSSFEGSETFFGGCVVWYVLLPPYVLHKAISRPQAVLKGSNRKGVFVLVFQHIVSPPGQTTALSHKCDIFSLLERTTKLCATIACQYTVGTSRHGNIVLSSRSPRTCHYPLFAYPLFNHARKTWPNH